MAPLKPPGRRRHRRHMGALHHQRVMAPLKRREVCLDHLDLRTLHHQRVMAPLKREGGRSTQRRIRSSPSPTGDGSVEARRTAGRLRASDASPSPTGDGSVEAHDASLRCARSQPLHHQRVMAPLKRLGRSDGSLRWPSSPSPTGDGSVEAAVARRTRLKGRRSPSPTGDGSVEATPATSTWSRRTRLSITNG